MTKDGIGICNQTLEGIRQQFEQGQLNAIRNIIPDSAILDICKTHGLKFRKRLLTPIVTVFHYLATAFWPEDSFQSVATIHSLNVCSSSIARARQRLLLNVMTSIFDYVEKLAETESEDAAYYKGLRVVLVDGTGISMEDNKYLMDAFGTSNSKHGKGKYPTARLATACLALTKTVLAYRLDRYNVAEIELAKRLLPDLRDGDLLIGDSHYAGANYYCEYLERGLQFITPVHQKLNVERLKPVKTFGEDDFIVELPVGAMHRKKDPGLPDKLRVRMVRVNLYSRRGKKIRYLVTSLLDPQKFSTDDIRYFYKLRWPIETLYYELKLPVSADILRSKVPSGIHKEMAAKMTAINVIRCIQMQAAKTYGIDISRISFTNSVRIIISTSLKMSTAPGLQLPMLYDDMLKDIAGYIVPYRPGRREPRRIRREKAHYQYLSSTFTRADWKRKHAVNA